MKQVIEGLSEGLQAIATAVSGGSGQQVPAPEAGDTGKVLKATGAGTVDWETDETGNNVPTVGSTDNAKVLTAYYSNGEGTYQWDAVPKELPAVTSADRGKVLAVNDNDNNLGWKTVSSGGSGPSISTAIVTGDMFQVVTDPDVGLYQITPATGTTISMNTKILSVQVFKQTLSMSQLKQWEPVDVAYVNQQSYGGGSILVGVATTDLSADYYYQVTVIYE